MQDQIAQIRQMFEEELDQNANPPPFHPVDIDRVRNEDWQIRRYLLEANGDVHEAYRALRKTLLWKQSFGVHNLSPSMFPTEFYSMFHIEEIERDREGRLIFTECYARQKHFPELHLCFRQLVVGWLEYMDRKAGEKGIMYLGDFTDTPILNMDIDLGRFRVEMMNKHYPRLAKQLVMHNAPMLVKPVLKLLVTFMRPSLKETVVFTNNGELAEHVDPQLLHTDMGGQRMNRVTPPGCVSFTKCYPTFKGLDRQFVDYFFNYHKVVADCQ